MHGVQQMRCRVRRTAPIVRHLAMREIVIDFPRMHRTALAHELEQELRSLLACRVPGSQPGYACHGTRMHQRLYRSRNETVDDEVILFDVQLHIQAFEVAGTVVLDAMTQRQVLSTSWRADRIGLDEAHPVQGTLQRGGLEETARDCKPPQAVKRDRHDWTSGPHCILRGRSRSATTECGAWAR